MRLVRITSVAILFAAVVLTSCGDSATSPTDTTPPTITMTSPTGSSSLSGTVAIRVSASDDSKLSRIEFWIDGSKVHTAAADQTSGSFSYSWDTRAEDDGIHMIWAQAFDVKGNEAGTPVLMVTVKNEQASPYTFTFHNPTQTPIDLTIQGHDFTIPVGDKVDVSFSSRPTSFAFTAVTSGKASGGQRVGLLMQWQGTVVTADFPSNATRLDVSDDYFFLKIEDRGAHIIEGICVNVGLTTQACDDITLPTTGTYKIGYYRAYTNGNVRLEFSTVYRTWDYGDDYSLPWSDNQWLTIVNTYRVRDDDPEPPQVIVGTGAGWDGSSRTPIPANVPSIKGTAVDLR